MRQNIYDSVDSMCSSFICPICQSMLLPENKTWQCNGALNPKHIKHAFDVSKQGYVNLLPVQQKKSKNPGDSQESIEARHRFLHSGHYEPLRAGINRTISHLPHLSLNDDKESIWLDIGCGEGYYSFDIAQALAIQSSKVSLVGVDISKPAVMHLAKLAKQTGNLWSQSNRIKIYPMVASASQLPLTDNSVTGISSIFSPILPKEFARVIKPNGHLIIAKPDINHLKHVRQALFDNIRPHNSDKFLTELEPFFHLRNKLKITCKIELNASCFADLLIMTPYAYRAKREKRQALLNQVSLNDTFVTEAHFVVYDLVLKS